jgi:hypothetical protein
VKHAICIADGLHCVLLNHDILRPFGSHLTLNGLPGKLSMHIVISHTFKVIQGQSPGTACQQSTCCAQVQERAQTEGWASGDIRLAVAVAQLSQQWSIAEKLLLSQGEAGAAVKMYRGLGMLRDAVRYGYPFLQLP